MSACRPGERPPGINGADVQELYDRAIALGDRALACLALEALEYGVGSDAWRAAEAVLAQGLPPLPKPPPAPKQARRVRLLQDAIGLTPWIPRARSTAA